MNNLNPHILVVDDSNVQRDYTISLCKNCNLFNINSAVNGVDALHKLKTDHFDLAFIDLEMPEMDGVELLRQIAKLETPPHIIILSSLDSSLIISLKTMAQVDGLSVLGSFKKPITIESIKHSLELFKTKKQGLNKQWNSKKVPFEQIQLAIHENKIELHYQPKLSIKGLILNSVEALARWEITPGVFIPPSDFILVAEESGLIHQLTMNLYTKSLIQKKLWEKKGALFSLAVNISPFMLSDPLLPDQLIEITKKHHIQPNSIIFEITENALSQDQSTAIASLAKLRMLGFGISIDDFGAGFANIQQLSRIPATELKIDRCLIENIHTDPHRQSILQSAVKLAKDLKLKIVAEGVEIHEEFIFLTDLNIDLVQGYYFAKPMDSNKLSQWITQDLAPLRNKIIQTSKK
ncbi:MAG: EAL domain-containing protein [Saccharospirillaceae bacterium]|nr:EAL domain-containing protein [Pseudomonadales bacterium]NRB79095.1 EAL domain-containing protein [Saccharospirillaceae bacterium]